MKKSIFCLLLIFIFYFCYPQYITEITYPPEGLKLYQNHLYFVRNDTIFSCTILGDIGADLIKYIPIKNIKNDYVIFDSTNVFFDNRIKRKIEFIIDNKIKFVKCEPSIHFIQIKEVIHGEYECIPLGPN